MNNTNSADRFYIIHKGRVALETFVPRSGPTTVQTVNAGAALGWSWLYPPYQWQFSARAVEPVGQIVFAVSRPSSTATSLRMPRSASSCGISEQSPVVSLPTSFAWSFFVRGLLW
jgi:hypothetical protein